MRMFLPTREYRGYAHDSSLHSTHLHGYFTCDWIAASLHGRAVVGLTARQDRPMRHSCACGRS